ncbi:MAG: M48 family metalloprotease [Hyphomicrobiales bacterium]
MTSRMFQNWLRPVLHVELPAARFRAQVSNFVRPVAPVLFLALLLPILSACNTFGGAPSLSGFGPNAGASVGKREHPRVVAAYGGIYRDRKVEALLDEVTAKLIASSSTPRQNYRLTVLNSPVVNAFALPGGYLYVTRGLLALANDTSEVAAVLSHEMAHVIENHAFQRQQRARQAKLVNKVVTDVIADEQESQIALASSQVSLASFSRGQELAADRIGVQMMARAGLDPYAAARFLTSMGRYSRFRAESLSSNANSPNFLASHPATPARISQVTEAARGFTSQTNRAQERSRYLDAIDGMTFGDDPSEGYVRGRSYLHPKLGFSFELPKGYTLENTSEAVLAADKKGTAVRFDGVQIPARQPLTDYMASGWVNGLDTSTIEGKTVDGLEAATADARAKGWRFRIVIIRHKGATYRFIFANADKGTNLRSDADRTLASFRKLGRIEAARLKPLSLKVVQVGNGDTVASLASQMRGVDRKRNLFLILNAIQDGASLRPGSLVKVVVD